ncbi:MAG: pyruvate oxidase [Bradyrhizobium sp.]|uniref:thiamine pyrophosphate-dependent enzyme n=1 Tax=Bradyrhizobium sp. TaxID=376 RepID=UPI001D68247A|nr:thiamine pyrophosphate-dependent enzyme [Bradyrhizobium sp.]MBV9559209.1 pyruvate oxidase [Bradyrhizobium sp.]
MSDSSPLHRRDFLSAATTGLVLVGAGVGTASAAAPTDTESAISAQPMPSSFGEDETTADIIVETLIAWGATHAFGIVGDGINSIIEALRKRQDRIRYVGVRHEEAAAFMASGFAKHTGQLGVCVGTTGPGAIHLLNGLYDAAFDGAPVVALTGLTFHDLKGVRYQQSVDTVRLMQGVALYNEEVTGPEHAVIVGNRACRAALGDRGVAHLTISKDVQMMKRAADRKSMRNPGVRTSSSWTAPLAVAAADQIRAAADILNSGRRVAILAGQGALPAREEVTRLAEMLGAPVAKSLLGKAVLADNSPFTTGGIGDLGTAPSSWAMKNCDTVMILGCTMPWEEYYPSPGQARGIQIDLEADRIGLRYPVEVGLVADVKATLIALLPLIQPRNDRSFLSEAQQRMSDWNALLDEVESTSRSPLRPQMVIRALSDLMADDAVISLDCGANTHFAARCLRLREGQRLTGTGMLASMAPGLPFAIAGQLAYPGRQSVAVVGDGGFAMLMAELSTAVAQNLPVKVVVLKNDSLAEVRFEQQELGNPVFGCDLSPIDFVAFAKACGADAFRCTRPEEIRPAIQAALGSSKPALVEAVVDADEKPTKPNELKA